MSRLRLLSASAPAIVLGIAGLRCSLTTSLDGLAGDPLPTPGSADAADAPADGAGVVVDASIDSADGGHSCASMFCDDFDDEGPLTKWTRTVSNAGGAVTRDRAASRSMPNSLLTTTPASTEPGSALVRLESPGTVHVVRFAYDMRVDARDPESAYAEVSYIRLLGEGDKKLNAFYVRLPGDATEAAGFTAETYPANGGSPLQHNLTLPGNATFTDWTRVEVVLDLGPAPSLTVSLDGKVAATAALEPSLYAPARATAESGIGYAARPSSGPWKVRYDNVTIDWEP